MNQNKILMGGRNMQNIIKDKIVTGIMILPIQLMFIPRLFAAWT
jgi:hypothetical protein